MPQSDSDADLGAQSSSRATIKRRGRTRGEAAHHYRNSPQIQPLPRWAKGDARAQDRRQDEFGDAFGDALGGAGDAQFFAGAGLALLDQILRAGAGGAEPAFAGCLRQRLALKAAATCARLARLREDEGALRDAEHLAGFDAAPTPGGRLHCLWRLFATRSARFDARFIRAAAECLDLPPDIDCEALAVLVRARSTAGNPLDSAAHVSAASLHILDEAPHIDAEIFALWLADLVLARRLGCAAPLPLLATTITHPSMRVASGRRPHPGDPDWSLSVARAYARAAQEAYALAAELSRRSNILSSVAPKLRAKKAARVVDLLLADDCVSPARAAKAAGLSDRASRRLFDRLVELGAVRELSGRANFRLYGL